MIPSNFLPIIEGRKRAMELLIDQIKTLDRKLASVRAQFHAEELCMKENIYEAFPDQKLDEKHWHLTEKEDSLGVCMHNAAPQNPLQQFFDMMKRVQDEDEPPMEGGSHLN